MGSKRKHKTSSNGTNNRSRDNEKNVFNFTRLIDISQDFIPRFIPNFLMNSNIAMENGIISLHNVILNGVANNMFSVLNPLTTEHVTKSSQCLRSHLITTIPLPWSQWNASSAASAMMEVFPHPDSPWTTRGCLLSPNTYSLIF